MPDILPKLPPGPVERAYNDKVKAAPGCGRIGGPAPPITLEEREAIAAERRAAQSQWLKANETPAERKARESEEKFAADMKAHQEAYKAQEARKAAARQAAHDAEVAQARAWAAAEAKKAEDSALLARFKAAKQAAPGKV